MGSTFNLTVPASGDGVVPINVSGNTWLAANADLEIAYEENGFNTNQYVTVAGSYSPQIMYLGTGKTVLWIRQDPTAGAAAVTLNVWTNQGESYL